MAADFPSNPANGATVVMANVVYVYNSAKGIWNTAPVTVAAREAAILQNNNLLTINKLVIATQ